MRAYDLTLAAEEDLRGIWLYSCRTWGAEQADRYLDLIETCCDAVGRGRARSMLVDGLPDGVHMHRCEHHRIVWLPAEQPIIIAFLHERMDPVRRLEGRLGR